MDPIITLTDTHGDDLRVYDEDDTVHIAGDSGVEGYELDVEMTLDLYNALGSFLAKHGQVQSNTTIIVNQFILASPEAAEDVLSRVQEQEAPAPRSVREYAEDALDLDRMLSFFYTSRGDTEPSFRTVKVTKVKEDRFEGFYDDSGDPEDYRQFLFSRVDESKGLYINP